MNERSTATRSRGRSRSGPRDAALHARVALRHALSPRGARRWISGRWVEKAGQRRRRYYRITEAGRTVLATQREDWARFIAALDSCRGRQARVHEVMSIFQTDPRTHFWSRRACGTPRRLASSCPPPPSTSWHCISRISTRPRADGDDDEAALARAVAALEESASRCCSATPRCAITPSRARRRSPHASLQRRRRDTPWRSVSSASIRRSRSSPCWCSASARRRHHRVFTVVDSVVLRPLPYAAPDRLVTLWDTNTEKGLAHDPISPVNFMDYRALPVFGCGGVVAAGHQPDRSRTRIRCASTPSRSAATSSTCSACAASRRGLPGRRADVRPQRADRGHQRSALAHALQRRSFDHRPQLSLNGTPYTVVGVMPAKFHYPDDIDVWQRLRWDLTQHSRAAHFMEAVARLSPTARRSSRRRARSTRWRCGCETEFPNTNKGWASRLVPLLDEQLGYYRPALMVLFGAVGLLLVIGCSERRLAAADAGAVARARNRRSHRDGRGAAAARRAAAGREPGAVGRRRRVGVAATLGGAAAHRTSRRSTSPPRRGPSIDARARAAAQSSSSRRCSSGWCRRCCCCAAQISHRPEGRRARQLARRAAHLLGARRRPRSPWPARCSSARRCSCAPSAA